MELAEYRNVFVQEDTHYYYQVVHDLVKTMIKSHVARKGQIRILDAGCGTGGLAVKLAEFGTVTGVDQDSQALSYSRSRGVKTLEASIENLPVQKGSFDLIVSIDVLYHQNVIDDEKALSEFYDALAPGAFMIIRVPARKELFSLHDKFVHTKRRYELEDLRSKLTRRKFKILKLTYCQSLLFAPALLKAKMEKAVAGEERKGVSAIGIHSQLLNSTMAKLLKLENRLIAKGFDMPIGIGLLAVCQKPR